MKTEIKLEEILAKKMNNPIKIEIMENATRVL